VSRRGFTLLESLIAGFLVVVAFYAVVGLYPTSAVGMRRAHDLVSAADLAQEEMEQKRATHFDLLAVGETHETRDFNGTSYRVERSVRTVGSDLKEVIIRVTWLSGAEVVKDQARSELILRSQVYNFRNP